MVPMPEAILYGGTARLRPTAVCQSRGLYADSVLFRNHNFFASRQLPDRTGSRCAKSSHRARLARSGQENTCVFGYRNDAGFDPSAPCRDGFVFD
jgi:hypothetical protein